MVRERTDIVAKLSKANPFARQDVTRERTTHAYTHNRHVCTSPQLFAGTSSLKGFDKKQAKGNGPNENTTINFSNDFECNLGSVAPSYATVS
eukprot:2572981-Amphidinium_carterae.2